MNELNCALAPIGATHFNICEVDFCWLKKSAEGEVWLFYNHACSEWLKCVASEEPELFFKIPEREVALNRLADECTEWRGDIYQRAYVHRDGGVVFPLCATSDGSFTKKEWLARRAERNEAGLIKVDNPITSSLTDSQITEFKHLKELASLLVQLSL